MKSDLVSELALEDQVALSILTFFEVLQDKGIPPLPYAWELPNVRGYAQEREGSHLPYFEFYFHRNSGKPFIRDNAKLFSVHVDSLDNQGVETSENLGLVIHYYLRNKVVATWEYKQGSSSNFLLLLPFIRENFNREHQYAIIHGLAEVTRTVLKLGFAYPRRLHLTGCDYNLLRKRTSVDKLIMDTTLFIESVRDITNVDSNPNLVQVQWDDDIPKQIEFLVHPLTGSEPYEDLVSMEFGFGVDEKCLMFKPAKFRDILESNSVLTPSADVEKVVELFGKFLVLLVSQDSYMTPDKVYSKEVTYFLHSLEAHVAELNYILNFLNLNYIFFKDQTRALDKVYCSFY